jgi:hypothetical protein
MPREHERIPYLTEIVLESSSGKRQARISDLGPGGCYIDSIAAVHDGEVVSFDIVMAEERMSFSGEVAYTFPGNGFGVRFTDLTDDKREFINRAMNAG